MKHVWNDGDAARLRAYIELNPKFIEQLEARVPEIDTTQTIEISAMSGARHAGAVSLIKVIREELQAPQSEPRSTPFIDPSRDN